MPFSISRRSFVKTAALTAAGSALLPYVQGSAAPPKEQVRLGIIGVGSRGRLHLSEMLKRKDVQVCALADPDPESLRKAADLLAKAGRPRAAHYGQGDHDYRNLLARDDVDAVIVASPWEWHLPQALDALLAGKIPGMEVAGALALDDCWKLVDSSEQSGLPVMILENVCYRRDIMAILRMVQQGMFGQLLHLQGGYQHDLRAQLLDGGGAYPEGIGFGPGSVGSARWRTQHYAARNGELYPTHSLGPIAMLLDINRGNRLLSLSSVASKSLGMNQFAARNTQAGNAHPIASQPFRQGDIVSTQLLTANGETIVLTYDTTSPRPYNLGFRVQGTRGIWQETHEGEPERGLIYFEGLSPAHQWENPQPYLAKHDHPLWQKQEEKARGSGHGGMDFFVDNAFIECLKRGLPFPFDVYDMATWKAVSPLSEASIAAGGTRMEIPDFTRGKWKERHSFAAFGARDF